MRDNLSKTTVEEAALAGRRGDEAPLRLESVAATVDDLIFIDVFTVASPLHPALAGFPGGRAGGAARDWLRSHWKRSQTVAIKPSMNFNISLSQN